MESRAIEPAVAPRDGVAAARVEVSGGLWVVTPSGNLGDGAANEMRRTCMDVLDRGALNVVLDLTAVDAVGRETADVFVAASDGLRARGGCLWFCHGGGESYCLGLAPVAAGESAPAGSSPVLETVLRQVPAAARRG